MIMNDEIPEAALWGAVFEQAVADVREQIKPTQKYQLKCTTGVAAQKRASQEKVAAEKILMNRHSAIAWLKSDSVGVGSCIWCCAIFNIYPDRVRRELGIK